MKPTVPWQFSKGWNTITIVLELVIIFIVMLIGLKPPEILISVGLILCGLLSGCLCNWWFIVHVKDILCKKVPESTPLCDEEMKQRKQGSRAIGLYITIIAIAFIIVWPSLCQHYDRPYDQRFAPAWFLAFICSQSLWFDLAKFRFLWGSKGILRKLTSDAA